MAFGRAVLRLPVSVHLPGAIARNAGGDAAPAGGIQCMLLRTKFAKHADLSSGGQQLELKAKAAERGQARLEISAGELHRIVGGYPSNGVHRMPMCCSVMRQEKGPRDTIVSEPPKVAGASLRISYALD